MPILPRLPRCAAIADRLSEFLDDELDDEARHEVALHLALCGACAQLALELAATIRVLHGLRAGEHVRPLPGASS